MASLYNAHSDSLKHGVIADVFSLVSGLVQKLRKSFKFELFIPVIVIVFVKYNDRAWLNIRGQNLKSFTC